MATILIKIEKWLLDKAEHFSAKKNFYKTFSGRN
jgi:hypothetical protein